MRFIRKGKRSRGTLVRESLAGRPRQTTPGAFNRGFKPLIRMSRRSSFQMRTAHTGIGALTSRRRRVHPSAKSMRNLRRPSKLAAHQKALADAQAKVKAQQAKQPTRAQLRAAARKKALARAKKRTTKKVGR